jgi:hypothetical protein
VGINPNRQADPLPPRPQRGRRASARAVGGGAVAAAGPPPGAANQRDNQQAKAGAAAAQLLAQIQQQNLAMQQALMRLGLLDVAAREIINNGISSLQRLRMLSEEALTRMVKQIHRDNAEAGTFIPFFSQESLFANHFWANRMHILGIAYETDQVTEALAMSWNQARKTEQEAAKTANNLDMIKQPKAFKKDTKWKQWKEAFVTYLHSKIGQANLPLAYIVRKTTLLNMITPSTLFMIN